MRKSPLLVTLAVLLLTAGAAAAQPDAQGSEPKWLFGLETRVGESEPTFSRDYEIGVIPNFSYFLTERVRLDGFVGFGYSSSDSYSLWLMPGARYYHRTAPHRLRINSGGSIGFRLLEEESFPLPAGFRDDLGTLRLVPAELEYWSSRRAAFIFAFDWEARIRDGGELYDEGYGVTAGFRIRMK